MELLARYSEWWVVILGVAAASFTVTGFLYRSALGLRLLPKVRERDVHTSAKPRIGGVAMWVVAFAALLVLATQTDLLVFASAKAINLDRALVGVLAGMVVLLVAGIIDDLYDLPAPAQLGGQLLAGLCLVLTGAGVTYLQLPFGGTIPLDTWKIIMPAALGGGTILVWSGLFTMLWVAVIINVLNFFDGLDGLAGSVSLTAAIVLLFVSLSFGLTATATLALVVAGTVAGFLPWNWYPSRLFMGTVGSQTLGFLLGTIAIISGGKVATAVLVLGVPFIDAIFVVVRRMRNGKSPFAADQTHLHHRLLRAGLSTPAVVLTVNSVAVIFGVLALRTQGAAAKGLLTLILALLLAGLISLTYALERRQVARVD